MLRDIQALPGWASIFGYAVLALGLVFIVGFITRYLILTGWHSISEEGRHLIAMSANIGAFFVIYLVIAVWPELPRWLIMSLRLGLLVGLVANCGWRWSLLERYHRRRARRNG